MNWFSDLSHESYKLHHYFKTFSYSKKLVLAALFSALAAILQSTGNFLPGIGYLISPFATLPILICTIISIPFGLKSYVLTFLLLILIQPGESFVFPFTTGIVGLGIGIALLILKRRIGIIVFTSYIINGWNLFSSIYCPFPCFRTNRQYISFIKGYRIYLYFFFYI